MASRNNLTLCWVLALWGVLFLPIAAKGEGVSAFLISNSSYPDDPVGTALGDMRLLQRALLENGVKIHAYNDLDASGLKQTFGQIQTFARANDDILILYIKGHAFSVGNSSYLVGVGSESLNEDDKIAQLKQRSFNLNNFVVTMMGSRSQAIIIILDACRTNLAEGSSAGALPLENVVRGDGNYVFLYSASPGSFAEEGNGEFSPFGKALADELTKMRDNSISVTFSKVIATSDYYSKNDPSISVFTRSEPVSVNKSRGEIYINSSELPPEAFQDDAIAPPNLEIVDLRFGSEDEPDPDPEQPTTGFDEPDEFRSDYVLLSLKEHLYAHVKSSFEELDVDPADIDTLTAETIESGQYRRIPTGSGSFSFVTKFNDVRLNGPSGNQPIFLVAGESDENIEWTETLQTDGESVWLIPSTDTSMWTQVFIDAWGGLDRKIISKYVFHEGGVYFDKSTEKTTPGTWGVRLE